MKKSFIFKQFLAIGLIAMVMTGCSNTGGEAAARNVGLQKDTKKSTKVIDTKTKTAKEEVVINQDESDSLKTQTMLSENEIEDPELVQAAVDKIKKYFDITVDISLYDISVTFFEAFNDLEASYSVYFKIPENDKFLMNDKNIGPDGYPLPKIEKKLKPEFFVSFSDAKEITDINLSYMGWKQKETPLSIKEVKEIAKEFVSSNEMIKDNKLVFMGSGFGDRSSMVIYENGKDGAIQVVVNSLSGNIEGFSYMSKERAELLLKPVKEGFGVG